MRNKTNAVKKGLDVLLTVLLLCLMAYQVTGEALHEWIGIGMTVLLLVHHILNRKWYAALFRGKYNAYRIVTTTVNTLLMASIALTAFCGMAMSVHAVPFLYGMAPMGFVRRTHLALSYWSFVLMGFHIGLHLPAITAKVKPNKTVKIIITVLFAALSGIGLWRFVQNGIPDYIFFCTPFISLDYEKGTALVVLENLAELFCFFFLGANAVRLIRGIKKKRAVKQPENT